MTKEQAGQFLNLLINQSLRYMASTNSDLEVTSVQYANGKAEILGMINEPKDNKPEKGKG